MGFVYLILALLGIALCSVAKANQNCQDKKALLTLDKDVLKCSIVGYEYVHNMMMEYRLHAEEEPQHLAAISFSNSVENARFSTEHLKEGLSDKKVYCSYQYKPTNTLMAPCKEIRSSNSIHFGFICPMIPPGSEVNQFQELTVKLNNPPDLYCIQNKTSCPLTAKIEFFNNSKPCRSRTKQSTSTSALLVYDSCTTEFTAENWKSGVVFKVLKNTNFFISNNIGKDKAVFLDFYYDAEKKHKHMKCMKPTKVNLKPVEQGMGHCKSFADPHIETFGTKFLHLSKGEYRMYQHPFLNTEVRTKQVYCTEFVETTKLEEYFWGLWVQPVIEIKETEVGCNQAVSIQIWDQVIVYSAKDGLLIEENYIGKMLVPQDDFRKKLMKGVRITKVDEDNYEVLLPNGDTVKVKLEWGRFSLTINIFSLPSNLYQVHGFCAITSHMNAEQAMKTYLIEEKDSNFKGTKEFATKQSSTQKVCLCESGKDTCMETLSFLGCNEAGN